MSVKKERKAESLVEKLERTLSELAEPGRSPVQEKTSSTWSGDGEASDPENARDTEVNHVPSVNFAGDLSRSLPPSFQKMKTLSESLRASIDGGKAGIKKSRTPTRNIGRSKVSGKSDENGEAHYASSLGSMNPSEMPHRYTRRTTNMYLFDQSYSDLVTLTESLCHRLDIGAAELDRIKSESEKRQRSFMRREDALKQEIARLKAQLEDAVRSRSKGDDSGSIDAGEMAELSRLRALHNGIQSSLGELKDRASKLVEEHRDDLVRHFRAKLSDLESQLRTERARADEAAASGNGSISSEWLEKTTFLSKELERYKEEAIRLDRANDTLSREVETLRMKCKSQEEDHDFLVRQMVALKRVRTLPLGLLCI